MSLVSSTGPQPVATTASAAAAPASEKTSVEKTVSTAASAIIEFGPKQDDLKRTLADSEMDNDSWVVYEWTEKDLEKIDTELETDIKDVVSIEVSSETESGKKVSVSIGKGVNVDQGSLSKADTKTFAKVVNAISQKLITIKDSALEDAKKQAAKKEAETGEAIAKLEAKIKTIENTKTPAAVPSQPIISASPAFTPPATVPAASPAPMMAPTPAATVSTAPTPSSAAAVISAPVFPINNTVMPHKDWTVDRLMARLNPNAVKALESFEALGKMEAYESQVPLTTVIAPNFIATPPTPLMKTLRQLNLANKRLNPPSDLQTLLGKSNQKHSQEFFGKLAAARPEEIRKLLAETFLADDKKLLDPYKDEDLKRIFANAAEISSASKKGTFGMFLATDMQLYGWLFASEYIRNSEGFYNRAVGYANIQPQTPPNLHDQIVSIKLRGEVILKRFMQRLEWLHNIFARENREVDSKIIFKLLETGCEDLLKDMITYFNDAEKNVTEILEKNPQKFNAYRDLQKKGVQWFHSAAARLFVENNKYVFRPMMIKRDRCVCSECSAEVSGWRAWEDPNDFHDLTKHK